MILQRRETRQLKLGDVLVGGGSPISIQSMTSTPTKDIEATLNQIDYLNSVGCDIVRLGIPDAEAAEAVGKICKKSPLPLVADIHFDYRLALIVLDYGVDGLRINPGNLKNRDQVEKVVKKCAERNVPIRIGVNAGSLDKKKYPHPSPEAMVQSALDHLHILEELNYPYVKVSLKSSDVGMTIEANRLFAEQTDVPLHLGVTEAGDLEQAIVKNSIGMGVLLSEGIGDTLRVSITADVAKEVETARTILRSLGLRQEGIEIISCPTCARKEFDVEEAVNRIKAETAGIRTYLKVAVMGCVVNGPGEAAEADIGIAVGKSGAVLFRHGEIVRKVSKDQMISVLLEDIHSLQSS